MHVTKLHYEEDNGPNQSIFSIFETSIIIKYANKIIFLHSNTYNFLKTLLNLIIIVYKFQKTYIKLVDNSNIENIS